MAGRRGRQAGRRGGFTYLEVITAAVIALTLAAVSVPLLAPRIQQYRLRSASWQVAGDLRLARQRAVTTRLPYRFVFADGTAGTDANSYVIQFAERVGPGANWIQELPAGTGSRQRLGGPVRIDPSSTPRNGVITFNPNGSVVPAATIRLRGPGGIALSVTVDQVGRVVVN